MHPITRREFAKTCAALAAAVPDLRFPERPRERLAVASYPFRAFLQNRAEPRIAFIDFAKMVADKFDVLNIEPLGAHFPSQEPAFLSEFRGAVERVGSHIVNIPVSVGASLYDPDPTRRGIAIATSRKWVDIAAAVGSPSIRVNIQRVKGTDPDPDRTSESLKRVAEYAAAKRIVVNLENDDLASEDALFLAKVIETVNSPWLRALPDFANSMLTGDAEFNYKAVAVMFEHAYNIAHVKDSEVSQGRVFRVDLGRTFAIAKTAGYRGYFSMEWEGQGGPYEGTQQLVEQSLQYLRA
jgi:sugar phosphate isomerase/epimerase